MENNVGKLVYCVRGRPMANNVVMFVNRKRYRSVCAYCGGNGATVKPASVIVNF
jgi:hypothetical protein